MSSIEFESIHFAVENGIATLTLNRPQALNSFTVAMHGEVSKAFDQIESDDSIRCLLITGAGRGFCAGQDLNDRAVAPGESMPNLGDSLENYYNPLIRRITSLPMPVICAVNGVAAGAGANIALACDIVIAGKSASFIQAFCKIGLIPDSGGTWSLPKLVGMARAKGLAMLGDKLPAEKAADWGLIWECVADESLMQRANELAQHFATQPTAGLAKIKQAMHASTDHGLDEHLDLERDLQRAAGKSHDYKEGVEAFLNKRAPSFKGK